MMLTRGIAVVLVISGSAVATTWTVDDDGKADFDNIQAAVDAASDGDEIVVMPGIYTSTQDGHVVNMLGKAVTLRSSDPSNPDVIAATIIDGENTRRGLACFNGETSKTNISGFTITKGYSVVFDYPGDGDSPGDGGGMFNYASSPTLTYCTFTGNKAAQQGGGMYNFSSSPTVTDCTFEDNIAGVSGSGPGWGGGVFLFDSNATLVNCSFTNNASVATGPQLGGGMMSHSSNPTLIGCIFTSNIGSEGGGINFNWEGNPTLINCSFFGNSANFGGGILSIFVYPNQQVSLTNCTFEGNTADQAAGWGIWWGTVAVLDSCTITNNTATNYGGGLVLEESDVLGGPAYGTLFDTVVCGNTPDQIYGEWVDGGGNGIVDVCTDCPDINGDGIVDDSDILAVIAAWGPCKGCPEDIDDSGTVDVTDVLAVIAAWGPCP